MKRIVKLVLPALALALVASAYPRPAHAQFAGGGGGFDQMQQFAPMLEMMKKKMGKKRFAMLMQTMGPMMSKMMDGQGGGFGGFGGGGGFGGFGGGAGGFDMSSMAGMMNFQDIAGMVQMFDGGGGMHHRRHHKKIRHVHY